MNTKKKLSVLALATVMGATILSMASAPVGALTNTTSVPNTTATYIKGYNQSSSTTTQSTTKSYGGGGTNAKGYITPKYNLYTTTTTVTSTYTSKGLSNNTYTPNGAYVCTNATTTFGNGTNKNLNATISNVTSVAQYNAQMQAAANQVVSRQAATAVNKPTQTIAQPNTVQRTVTAVNTAMQRQAAAAAAASVKPSSGAGANAGMQAMNTYLAMMDRK